MGPKKGPIDQKSMLRTSVWDLTLVQELNLRPPMPIHPRIIKVPCLLMAAVFLLTFASLFCGPKAYAETDKAVPCAVILRPLPPINLNRARSERVTNLKKIAKKTT